MERRKGITLLQKRYTEQKCRANARGIDFNLTFDEWFDWWDASGHFHERGCRKGQYVMARYGDTGPYEFGNIKCITVEENGTEGNKGKKRLPRSKKWCATISKNMTGKKRPPRSKKHKEKLAANRKGKTWEEIYGVEKAAEMKAALSKRVMGNKNFKTDESCSDGF